MAKIKGTNMPVSGKLNGKIFSKTKHGLVVREAPDPGSYVPQPALTKQSDRTGYLNKLAGEINRAVDENNEVFKDSKFYIGMTSLFRDEPLNNRFLLLLTLKGYEINPVYRLAIINYGKATVTEEKDGVLVTITAEHHPYPGQYHATGYDYELMLLSYDKTTEPPVVETQLGPWIKMNERLGETCFLFKKQPGLTHWVLIMRLRLGTMNEQFGAEYAPFSKGEGMQIVEVGSFDDEEIALLTARQQEIAARKPALRQVDTRERKGWVRPTTDH